MIKEALFPEELILKTNNFFVAQDCEVPIPGFFIVSTIRTINSLSEFNSAEQEEFMKIISDVRIRMSSILGISKVYLFQNEDSEHNFHVWLFPRYDWMKSFGEKIESVRPIMNHAKTNFRDVNSIEEVRKVIETMRKSYALCPFN